MGATRHPSRKRRDIYQDVTQGIIADLENGVAPWVKPWENLQGSSPVALPKNPTTGNRYSGINILLLWASALKKGHPTQHWMTYKQAQEIRAQVRKGETSSAIVHVGAWRPKEERVNAKAQAKNEDDEAKSRSFLKRYAVFNISQIDGLPEDMALVSPALTDPIDAVEALLKATGADFRIGGDCAFYVPDADFIQVPAQTAFGDPLEYYSTCLHELTHWTKAKHRLERAYKGEDGAKDYAREELVAELGAAFLCAHFGITPTLRHADYLGSWLKVLKEDNRAIIKAASAASKAVEFILSFEAANEATLRERAAA